jgi:transcriptional regulator with XRE-family HTH domain
MTENTSSSDSAFALPSDLRTFGERLTCAVTLAGVTQRELARAICVTPQAIAKLCRISSPRTSSLRLPEIAAFLRVPVDWLAYGHSTPLVVAEQASGVTEVSGRFRLTDLQSATLGKLAALMANGALDDLDCLELLTGLKPKLVTLRHPD